MRRMRRRDLGVWSQRGRDWSLRQVWSVLNDKQFSSKLGGGGRLGKSGGKTNVIMEGGGVLEVPLGGLEAGKSFSFSMNLGWE